MVTFDAKDRGTLAGEWRRSPTLRGAAAADPAPFASLLVVAAHPDDETLMAGGLIARFAASGRPVTVVVATDGAASHPDSPTHTPERLAELRAAEVAAALTALAPGAELVLLGLPDGRLDQQGGPLRDALRSHAAPDTLLVSTWAEDGHPDHAAAAEAAAAVAADTGAAHWQAPIWLWHWGSPDGDDRVPALDALALSPTEQRAKRRAIDAHASQHGELSGLPGDEALLSPDFLEHFRGPAEFFVTGRDPEYRPSLGRTFFEEFYGDEPDPWGFETRWYERRKRDLTLAVLPRARFARTLEIGCAIGMTTEALATRSDRVLALDIAERPLERARRRLGDAPGVAFERRAVPADWPDGRFDLIVVSEVGYYLGLADLDTLVSRCHEALTEDGVLVVCHWRHGVADYPLTGDAVHDAFSDGPLALLVRHVEADFRLDVFAVDPRSVGQLEGLV